ncbi:MAG: hypothetical protein A3H02_02645 [Candidatus Niyogibacteria bacterium RIFCSPLOWO2_12_FULL_41_13]|uniref:N-acetylmuramoyl-L-alanine amidase domain-containing protein n=1 Tax=Candidatus Niyogibacteria bacterium RIFCSPLOWO2_12_FULL_41_13 TaxID=1801726 RepID=A0A1G2F1W6_9BACT|nr:MAG: hypothetical protein A3H02_02645 [Candidatus Niyogibacteria bacterium RIFCSPLOWO2_12_FULL_41_13]
MKHRGWDDISYHYVICRDEMVETGRPENLVGAHARKGGRNRFSIGGLVGENNFTEAQIESLKILLAELCQKYNITDPNCVQRHHDKCPGPVNLEKIAQEILG